MSHETPEDLTIEVEVGEEATIVVNSKMETEREGDNDI